MNNGRGTKWYRKHEAEVMKHFGLKPTKNSGAGWIEKSDGQNEFLICELKSTDAESYRLKLEDLHKLENHAIVAHKIPVFIVDFLGTNEAFVIVKPVDLPSVAQYLECGKCDIIKTEVVAADAEPKVATDKKVVTSSPKSRDKFWKEQNAKWKK